MYDAEINPDESTLQNLQAYYDEHDDAQRRDFSTGFRWCCNWYNHLYGCGQHLYCDSLGDT